MSPEPVAEAVAWLAKERLVDVKPQKGTFVARIRMDDVAEAAFVRCALEVAAVERVSADIDQATLERLERNLADQAAALAAEDVERSFELGLDFHDTLFERLGMSLATEAFGSSRAQLERARRLLLPLRECAQATLSEHRAITAALATRDPERAAGAMKAHLDALMSELRRFQALRPDLFES